jgi:hypothetical protein
MSILQKSISMMIDHALAYLEQVRASATENAGGLETA